MQTGTVEWVGSKTRNTRFGEKEAWSVKIDGEFYNHGFKKPAANRGDQVQYTYKETQYGKEITGTLLPVTSGSGGSGGAAASKQGAWPIPKDAARDRSIIRQSSLKVATDLVIAMGTEINVDDVILVARRLEEYVTGESDEAFARELEAMVEGTD